MIPAKRNAVSNVGFKALVATRLDRSSATGLEAARKRGHKPGVGSIEDPEIKAYITGGYATMRPGLTYGARRGVDQDIDGIELEFLYPGYFAMFSMRNVELLVALQKNYNDSLHDFCTDSGGRLYSIPALPVQDPTVAMTELERVITLGYKGVIVPGHAPKRTRYSDEVYEPI